MNKPLLLFQGPIGTRSGYGDHGRDILKSLIEMDRFDIKIIDLPWGACPRNALKKENPDHLEIINRILNQPLNRQPDIFIQLSVPNEFRPIGKYNIGISAGMETTLIPPEWLEGLNRMNLIIVPSEHSKRTFISSTWTKTDKRTGQPVAQLKTETPVEVLFEGLDTNIFKKTNKKEKITNELWKNLSTIPENFNFLFVGHWIKGNIGHDRKDVGMLIKVFLETFKNSKNAPGLVLKTSGATLSVMDRNEIMKKINAIKSNIKAESLPNIYLLHGDLTEEEMNFLYNHPKIKVHISFTKGEGFGRPLLEATVSEKPLIVSGWSGHMDFLNQDLATLLPGELNNIDDSAIWEKVIIKESKWFTVNYGYASNAMKAVFKDYQKFSLKAKQLAIINKNKFSLEKMSKKFEEILNKYLSDHPKEVELNLPNASNDQNINLPDLPELPKLEQIGEMEDKELPKIKDPVHGSNEGSGDKDNTLPDASDLKEE